MLASHPHPGLHRLGQLVQQFPGTEQIGTLQRVQKQRLDSVDEPVASSLPVHHPQQAAEQHLGQLRRRGGAEHGVLDVADHRQHRLAHRDVPGEAERLG
jgi:hypothetical protein